MSSNCLPETAFVWTLPTVWYQMCPQSACLRKCVATLVAFVWFSSTVPSTSNFVFTAVHYVMSNVSANYFPKRMHDHSEIYPIPSTYSTTVLFSTMCLQMFPQNVRTRKCIATLVAFVRLFSTMHFQMFPKIACPEGCIIALVAFSLFFSRMYCQMIV